MVDQKKEEILTFSMYSKEDKKMQRQVDRKIIHGQTDNMYA